MTEQQIQNKRIKELEAEGLEVITTPIDALSWQGGGFRCWHHPLIRLG